MTARAAPPATRGTIFLEPARVVSQLAYDAEQFVLRLAAPKCAAHAQPGSFVHLTCDAAIPMRRPLSIMRAAPRAGWIEILYKVVGPGLHALAARKAGDEMSCLGPIGKPFTAASRAAAAAAARRRRRHPAHGVPRRAAARAQRDALEAAGAHGLGGAVSVSQPALDPDRAGHAGRDPRLHAAARGVGHRLAPRQPLGLPGLLLTGSSPSWRDAWLATLSREELAQIEIFACGPTPMLKASAALARRYQLPCQVSLEEFMACAVGGCAGCTVPVRTPEGPAMKRVCVDGPVFDAYTVF